MKKIYVYLSLTIAAAVWSCEEKENLDPVGNWELAVPVLSAPMENASIVLNEASPLTAAAKFEWQPAAASNRFVVAYTFQLIPDNGTEPIFTMVSSNGGKDLFVTPTAQQIDYALWAACYPAGATANLKWIVVARAIEKTTESSQKISIKRFDTEYIPTTLFITGEATEVGTDVGNAVKMRARKDADGNETGIFDVYTTLTEGKTYNFRDQANISSRKIGGSNGTLSCGTTITAPGTAQYRVTVDFNDNSYELWKVEKWSLVGSAVEGGWDGDIPLAYKGNGLWEGKVEFVNVADFIFRANGDWGYIIKRIEGLSKPDNSQGKALMESEQAEAGVTVQNLISPGTGVHIVKLDLSSDGYSYSLVAENPAKAIIGETKYPTADAVAGNFTFGQYAIPSQLFLLSGDDVVGEFTKDGKVFRSVKYLALEASKKYTLNSAADGSGTAYNNIGDGTIAVDHDQAYQINVDFETTKLSWKHYNMKLFHWDDVGGGWDQRQELLMTYTHPYKYEVTGSLTAGFDSKFNSPWDVQFGTNATALSGTMTNGGVNYKGIISSGSYKANITVSDDYATANYAFVKQ